MRKIPVFAVLLGLLAFGAQPAHAYPSDHLGECHMIATEDPTTGGSTYLGVLFAHVVVYDTDPARNPVTADVHCYVKVNGVNRGGTVATGTTTVTALGTVSFVAQPTDLVQLCTEIVYWNGSPPWLSCPVATRIDVPPPVFWDLAQFAKQTADPTLCFVLAIVRGIPGIVETDPSGDVFVLGSRYYDCPPYGGGSIGIDASWASFYIA